MPLMQLDVLEVGETGNRSNMEDNVITTSPRKNKNHDNINLSQY